jgi:hypothetical protein
MSNRVNVVYLPERLDRITQALLPEGFQVLRIGKRQAAEGPDCFVLGKMTTDDPKVAEEAVKRAALSVGFVLEGVKAGRVAESAPWQVDFTAVNLFEDEDDQGVSTFLKGGFPGYAEIQRATALRDTLRKNGIPIYKVEIQPPSHSFTGSVYYTMYLDNHVARFSRTKVHQAMIDAVKEMGVPVREVKVQGKGTRMQVIAVMIPIRPELDAPVVFEAEDDDLVQRMIGQAVEFTPEYGDEKRLYRLASFLKKNEWTYGYVECQARPLKNQYATPSDTQNWGDKRFTQGTAQYYIAWIKGPPWKYGCQTDLEAALKADISRWSSQDAKLTGGPNILPHQLHLQGDFNSGLSVWFYLPSFRHTEDINWPIENSVEWDQVKESEEDDMEQYSQAAVSATPHLRTRMFINDLTTELKAQGLPLYGRISYKLDWAYKHLVSPGKYPLLINVYLDSYQNGEAVLEGWATDRVRAALNKLGKTPVRLSKADWTGPPVDIAVKTHDQVTMWLFMVVEGFEPLEGDWMRESEDDDLDTMFGIGERERLYAIMRWTHNNVNDTLWAYAEPARMGTGRAPGSTYVRIRMMGRIGPEFVLKLFKRIYASGIIEPLNEPNYPQHPDLHYMNVDKDQGIYDIDMFLAPTGKPITQRIYAMGPDIETYRHLPNVQPPDGIVEVLDPDTEMWVRGVVEQTPGYKDRERLKAALKLLASQGLDIEWALQFRAVSASGSQESMAEVQLCIKHTEPTPASTTHYVHVRDLIEKSLKAYWDVNDVSFGWQSPQGNYRVFAWQWLSHDAPEDQSTIELRNNEWAAEAQRMLCDYDRMLVMEADPPMENEPDIGELTSQALDRADPPWRDRIRIEKLAQALKAEGLAGTVVQSFTVAADTPFIQLRVWMPQEDFLPAPAVRNKVRTAMLASGIWSAEHIEKVLMHPTLRMTAGRGGPHGSNIYVLTTSYEPVITHGDAIKLEFGESELRPVIEFLPEAGAPPAPEPSPEDVKMMQQMTRRAVNTPEQVLVQAFRHVKDKLKEMGYNGWITITANQDVGHKSHKTFVDAQLRLDTRNTTELVLDRVAEIIRDALLDGGLRRYYPRRSLYFKWPKVEVFNSGHALGLPDSTVFDFHVRFHLSKPIDGLHVHWPSIQEARKPVDPDARMMRDLTRQTIKRVYPDLEDKERLRALAADLKALGYRGTVRLEPDYKRITGKAYGGPPSGYLTGDLIPPPVENPADVWTDDERLRLLMIDLLRKHGYGEYKQEWGWKQITTQGHYDDDGVRHTRFMAPNARTSTMKVDDFKVNIQEADQEIDPEDLLRQANVGTIWDNRSRLQNFAASISAAGYEGTLHFSAPDDPMKLWVYGSGKLVPTTGEPDTSRLQKAISQALKDVPDWDYTPHHIRNAVIHVNYRITGTQQTSARFLGRDYYFYVEFFMPVSMWKEDGSVYIDIPSMEYAVDVKI